MLFEISYVLFHSPRVAYTNAVEVDKLSASLMSAAEQFGIKSLFKKCQCHLSRNVTSETAGGKLNGSFFPNLGEGGTMVSFHLIGANTQKMCAKKSLNKKFSLKFLIKLKPRTSKPSKKFLFL